jgi:ATP-dependent helicase/nuclease subunit B
MTMSILSSKLKMAQTEMSARADRNVCATLNVTAFKDYLACPFTYYLRRVLKMETQNDRARELDPMQFGQLCHDALDAFAKSADNESADPNVIQSFLENHVWQSLHRRFGKNLTAVLHLQGAAACERLGFAAQEQARLAAQGWRIFATEQKATLDCFDVPIRGRIDRIDFHEESGAVRILDYKTWATLGKNEGLDRFSSSKRTRVDFAIANGLPTFTPEGGGRPRVWTDLQLPLYLMMHSSNGFQPLLQCGYFVLGDTAADTLVKAWDFSGLRESAEETACAVVSRICAGIFWPPLEIAEEFRPLFLDPLNPENSISPEWVEDQKKKLRPCVL